MYGYKMLGAKGILTRHQKYMKNGLAIVIKGGNGLISSGAYNYINVLEKACDASWTRNSVISNNIANVDTPNYKRKDIDFETYLMGAVCDGDSLDDDIANIDLETLTCTTYTEYSNLSYRLDGNNVDIDTESAELAKNQLKYYTMLDSVSQEFSRLKSVLKSN